MAGVHTCTPTVPRRTSGLGKRPSETSENKRGLHSFWPGWEVTSRPSPRIRPFHPNPSPETRRTRGNVCTQARYVPLVLCPSKAAASLPLSCHLLPCPASLCVAFPRTRAASMWMIHISSWGSLRGLTLGLRMVDIIIQEHHEHPLHGLPSSTSSHPPSDTTHTIVHRS